MQYEGGKFEDKAGYRSAWNNYVHILYDLQLVKTFKSASEYWQREKKDTDLKTIKELIDDLRDTKRKKDDIAYWNTPEKKQQRHEAHLADVKYREDQMKGEVMRERIKEIHRLIKPLLDINEYLFDYKRHQNRKIESNAFNDLFNAVKGYSFFPTPHQTCHELHDRIIKDYGDDADILDIASGTGNLSMPFLEYGDFKTLTMVELNPLMSNQLKKLEKFDDRVKVIHRDIFDIPSNEFKATTIIMNPPFEKNLYLKFILKACDIMICNRQLGRNAMPFYVICPKTGYKADWEDEDKGTSEGNITFPKTMLKEMISNKNIINKQLFEVEEDDPYVLWRVMTLGEVKGFKTFARNGSVVDLKMSNITLFGMFI